jgi:FtsP/CotA-like multicopper oxidase with cupredoxin domain
VDEPDALDVDHDLPLAIDDWRLDPETVRITDDFDNFHDLSHAGRIGNLVTVNGQFDPHHAVNRHDRLRLRLVNAANARVFRIGLAGLAGWIVALDGMPLDTPIAVEDSVTLAPAQRADLIVDVTAETGTAANLVSLERDGSYGLMRFDVRPGTRMRRPEPAALPPNPLPALAEAASAPLHDLTMQGGAMRGLAPSMLGATLLDMRELAQLGKFWALNGRVDRPEDPFLDLNRGETRRIAMINDTVFPHGMHLHGHHFRAILDSGALGPWRDTLLVQPGETRQIVFCADNPGSWLLHCHMLGHAAAGMMTWFRVSA